MVFWKFPFSIPLLERNKNSKQHTAHTKKQAYWSKKKKRTRYNKQVAYNFANRVCVCVWRHSWSNCKISNETNCVLQWQIDNRRLMKSVGWKIRRLTCVWVRTFISLLGFLSLSLSLARHCRLSVVFSVVSGLCASMYRSISHVLGSALLMCMPFDYLSVCWQQQTTYLLPN